MGDIPDKVKLSRTHELREVSEDREGVIQLVRIHYGQCAVYTDRFIFTYIDYIL